jgi:hypothetical protein
MKQLLSVLTAMAIVTFTAGPGRSQIPGGQIPPVQYARGQDIQPAFEGWERNADGSFNFVFGYLNRNYEEQVDVPIGPDNTFEPGGDRGQPTHFYIRRNYFIFKVAVPKDWDQEKKIIWKVTAHGKTNVAKGWLQPEWELNNGVISENLGGGGSVDEHNQPPSIRGDTAQTIRLPAAAIFSVTATDDDRPHPKARPGRPAGVGIRWIWYRGPGPVTFEPDSTEPVYRGPVSATTTAHFGKPGDYVIRAVASDGALQSVHDFKVTVLPSVE